MKGFLGRYLKLDLEYFLRGGVWLFVGQILAATKSIAISVFLARAFGVEDFGRFAYIMAVFSMASVFGSPGMGIAVFQSVSRGYDGTLALLSKKVFFAGLFGSLSLIGFQMYSILIQGESHDYIFLALAFLFPFYSVGNMFAYHVSGLKRFRQRTFLEAWMSIAVLFFSFLMYFFSPNIYHLAFAVVATQTLFGCGYVYYFVRSSSGRIDGDAVEFGKKLNRSYAVPMLKAQLDRILISHSLGYTKTALYNVAYSLGDQVSILGKIVGILVLPKTSLLSNEEIKKKLTLKNLTFIFFALLAISISIVAISPYLIVWLFGDDFREAIPYAQVILLFIPIKGLAQILRNVHESQKNVSIINFINNQLSLAEILLMLVGLFFFQVWGVIFAKILVDSVSVILQITFLYKKSV